MRIQLKKEGGFAFLPGLSRPVTIDTKDLTLDEAKELERLVEEANFFQLPDVADQPPSGAADFLRYTMTVEDGGQAHTVVFTQFNKNPNLQALRRFLESKGLPRSNKGLTS
ncbi:MAG TPA: protealysin inhibitor emfourin [Chthonomonadaceae bacterium]|nr:protealysin inhibitor emfourin [Chthonomonadaceae bacterium]